MDDIIANRERTITEQNQQLQRLRIASNYKESDKRAKDESMQRLQKRLDAEMSSSRSVQQNLDRQVHELKQTVFRKSEEILLLQAQARHRARSYAASSGSPVPTRLKSERDEMKVSDGTVPSSCKKMTENDGNDGAGGKGVLKEEPQDNNTGKDSDQFLDHLFMDKFGSNAAHVKVESDVEVVALRGSKRNLCEDDGEMEEEAKTKRIKQEPEY
jgi:hypothetical protein